MSANPSKPYILLSLFCFWLSAGLFAQKKKQEPRLDKRKYAIEIREITTEGKKFEKDVFEFTPREIISDYVDTRLKVQTIHYKVIKDSTYTEEGDELKYWKITGAEKTGKPEEELRCEAVIAGKEITGTIKLCKGDVVKRSYEFEGAQSN